MVHVAHVVAVRWWSAIAAYAIDLATAQHRTGRRVTVCALADSPSAERARAAGVPLAVPISRGVTGQLRLARDLARHLARERPDVVHVHTGAGHAAAEIARSAGAPAVALVRTKGEVRRPQPSPWNRWLYRRADAVAVPARFLAPPVRTMTGRDPAVIPGAIDAARFVPFTPGQRAEARRSLGLPDDAFVAGIVARLSPVKGHRVLLEAWARLVAGPIPKVLVIAGEPAQLTERDVREWTGELGIADRVRFVGRLEDVRTVLAALDVGVVASTGSEAICRIGGELMASGLPVVASDVSVLPDMITDGETGRLVPPGDSTALAAALSELARDPDARASLGNAARRWAVTALARDVIVARHDELYASALARRGAPIPAGSAP